MLVLSLLLALPPARADDDDDDHAGPAPAVSLSGFLEGWAVHDSTGTTLSLRRAELEPEIQISPQLGADLELEVENATDFELEEAFVHANPWKALELSAGIVLVPVGSVNLSHVPTEFDGVDRPLLDQTLIPTTWRELGVLGRYALSPRWSVTAGAVAGPVGSGLRPWSLAGARGQGLPSSAADLAATGRLSWRNLDEDGDEGVELGLSGFGGGVSGGDASLDGARIAIGEADLRVRLVGFDFRAEAAGFSLTGADRVTEAFRALDPSVDAMGSLGAGAQASLSYDLLRTVQSDQQLRAFARYEALNPRLQVPSDEADGGDSYAGQYLCAGLGWWPQPRLAIKADATFLLSGTALPGSDNKLSLGVDASF